MMTNHDFYVILSSRAFQRTIKELKWKNPPISHENTVSACCLNYAFSGLILQWQNSLNQASSRTSYSAL